jgi:hypothetical protein
VPERVEGVGDAEVGQLAPQAVRRGCQKDVLRLEIAVHDSAGVGVRQGVEQLEEHPAELGPAGDSILGEASRTVRRKARKARHLAFRASSVQVVSRTD